MTAITAYFSRRPWILMAAAGLGLLYGLLWWKNAHSYGERSPWWRAGKSSLDLALIVGAALRLPALLIAWCVLWFVRPIQHPALRTTIAVAAGITLGLAGNVAMEILIFFSIFAVDLVTGAQGFLLRYDQVKAKRQDKMASIAA